MTNEWSRVVKNLKMVKIGHVTYHSNGNSVVNFKMVSKLIERGHLRSSRVNFIIEIPLLTSFSITSHMISIYFILHMLHYLFLNIYSL